MSTSRAWDISNSAGPSNSKVYPSRSRRSSSSIRRRSRNESSASLLPYDPDTYTDDLIPQDVIFDGPSASSVPTSVSNFAHRASRASFAEDDRAAALRFFAAEFDSDAEDVLTEVDPEEEDRHSILSSRASEVSSVAVLSTPDIERGGDQFPLISRKSLDQRSEGSFSGRARSTQKIYLSDEDMVVVMSGFCTRRERLWIYRMLCILTFGMVYLLLRWLPRWRLKFLAEPLPLSEAHWVVVEVPTPTFHANSESMLRFIYTSNSINTIWSTPFKLFCTINSRRSRRRPGPRRNSLPRLPIHSIRIPSYPGKISTHE